MTSVELLIEAVEKRGLLRRAIAAAGGSLKTGYKFMKSGPRDIRRMRRMSKWLKNPQKGKAYLIAQNLGPEMSKYADFARRTMPPKVSAVRATERLAPVGDLARGIAGRAKQLERLRAKAGKLRTLAVKRTAIRLGALGIGATAGSYAYRAYKLRKRQAQEKAKYRDYHVYSQHNYATAPIQPENRMAYYGASPPEAGPPRSSQVIEDVISNVVDILLSE